MAAKGDWACCMKSWVHSQRTECWMQQSPTFLRTYSSRRRGCSTSAPPTCLQGPQDSQGHQQSLANAASSPMYTVTDHCDLQQSLKGSSPWQTIIQQITVPSINFPNIQWVKKLLCFFPIGKKKRWGDRQSISQWAHGEHLDYIHSGLCLCIRWMGTLAPASVFPDEDHSIKLQKSALAFWRPDQFCKADMKRTSRARLL